MATGIKQIAEFAGVSTTTVSHVINNTRYVSEEKRERVREAIIRLNYRPNRLASGLRRRRSNTIGLVTPDIVNPYFTEVARGVEDACFEASYSAIICNSDANPKIETHYLAMLAEKQIDGIILVNAGNPPDRPPTEVVPDIPLVMLDRELAGLATDSILVDNVQGGRIAADYLHSLGHRDVICLAGLPGASPTWRRVESFVERCRKNGCSIPDRAILQGDFQTESGYQVVRRRLQDGEKFTAAFATNDLMAYGAVRAIVEAGLRIPRDVSVIGFDDISLSKLYNPPLTTIRQPLLEMGRAAVRLLLERIADPHLEPRRIVFPVELITRQTAGKRG